MQKPMKHNPRLTNPTPVMGAKTDLRKARMAAGMNTGKNETPQPGKQNWMGVSVESLLGRSKRS